jgi:hypothetical protein
MRWDGAYFGKAKEDGSLGEMEAEDIQSLKTYIDTHRSATTPFDIVRGGQTPGDNEEQARAILRPLVEAGVTWWLESIGPWRGSLEDIHKRIQQGPTRIA